MMFLETFALENKPIVIVGGGHAGIEAAFAVARLGVKAKIIGYDARGIVLEKL